VDGVVASVQEGKAIRKRAARILIVTPGVRSAENSAAKKDGPSAHGHSTRKPSKAARINMRRPDPIIAAGIRSMPRRPSWKKCLGKK